ncbi:MAG: alpha/beta hydrolase-fold protein, partial [Thermoguttaceae bacterium]
MKNRFITLCSFVILFLSIISINSFADTLKSEESESGFNENPTTGKQVLQCVELPASTSTWDYSKEHLKRIGEPRPLDESKIDQVFFWIYLPLNYEEQSLKDGSPLVLFLHGAGERGNSLEDTTKVKVHGPPKNVEDPTFQKNWPCVTVSPQCKDGFAWSPAQLMLLLDHIEANYKIDKKRIYVTGLSMGGFGSFMCLNESPARFAAVAPICGGALTE